MINSRDKGHIPGDDDSPPGDEVDSMALGFRGVDVPLELADSGNEKELTSMGERAERRTGLGVRPIDSHLNANAHEKIAHNN
jgi:hypothetical protein